MSENSLADLLYWLAEQHREPDTSLPIPMVGRALDLTITPLAIGWGKVVSKLHTRRHLKWFRPFLDQVSELLTNPYYHHKYTVHWAINRAKQRYHETDPL